VRASDRGEPPSHADVDVDLDVVDRNNKPPLWDQSTYGPIRIGENVIVGTIVTSIRARYEPSFFHSAKAINWRRRRRTRVIRHCDGLLKFRLMSWIGPIIRLFGITLFTVLFTFRRIWLLERKLCRSRPGSSHALPCIATCMPLSVGLF